VGDHRRRAAISLLLLVPLLPGRLAALGAGGLTRLDPPRAQALGGAGAAVESDAAMVLLNPAAVARVASTSVSVAAQTDWLGGASGTMFGVHPTALAAITAGVLYYNAGLVTLNALDGTSRQVNAGTDLVVLAGIARSLTSSLSLGCSAYWYRSQLADAATASTVLADLGAQMRLSPSFKIGLAVKRLGTSVRYLDDRVAPPTTFRAGAAYAVPLDELLPETSAGLHHLVLVADGERDPASKRTVVRGGAEYWWHGLVILRGGGQAGSTQALGSATAGLGLRLLTPGNAIREYRLDYCLRLLNGGFDTPHNLSLALAF